MPSLERRTLGGTGLAVSVLGYGAGELRGPRIWQGRHLTDDQAAQILNTALDAGINFIDTAYDYGRGEAYTSAVVQWSTPATMTRRPTSGPGRISPRGWRNRCAG
jgi:aryl-alcohol dehydrogenase-like predicted oxidoreductase